MHNSQAAANFVADRGPALDSARWNSCRPGVAVAEEQNRDCAQGPQRVVVLSGGVGGARFIRGLRLAAGSAAITVIANVADDLDYLGLRICPDLDTIMYTLAGVGNESTGWGRDDESWNLIEELGGYGQPTWFRLGDRDLATHVLRSHLLRDRPLSAVTAQLSARWDIGVTLLPASDDSPMTIVELLDGSRVHFQRWWIDMRAEVAARRFELVAGGPIQPAPGVLEALATADMILLAPSNPVVSIGMIIEVPGIRDALRTAPAPVVGVSPIIAGRPVLGRADACLNAIDVESTAAGVAALYGNRSAGGLLDGWLVDNADRHLRYCVPTWSEPILMSDQAAASRIARRTMQLATHVSTRAAASRVNQ